MTQVDISVVVPVFNGGSYLAACLDSISLAVDRLLPAERDRVEVVVCDNWSTDGSFDVASSRTFGCRSRVVRPTGHLPNRTQNWHHGLSAAEGTWMMMLHADDLMSPGGLTSQLSVVSRADLAGVAMVSGRYRTFSDADRPSSPRPRWPFPSRLDGTRLARTVLPLHCPFVPFTLMRRSTYEQVGGLDDQWELVQDWELWMRLASAGDVLYHPNEVGMWRQHDVSEKYRRLNAKEHVGLSRSLDRSVPRLTTSMKRRAASIQAARADQQTAVADAAVEPELSTQTGSEEGRTRNATILRGASLEVSARLYAARLVGTAKVAVSAAGRWRQKRR